MATYKSTSRKTVTKVFTAQRILKSETQLELPEANPVHTETLMGEAYLNRLAELYLFGAIIYGVREGKQNGEWVVTWREN